MALFVTFARVQLVLFCVLVHVCLCQQQEHEYVLRWSSSGGGWRSMVATMAFANVFAQAGLISEDASAFSGISTNSGSSWFSVQFFYSQLFFDRTISSSPSELGEFSAQWMRSYKTVVANIPTHPFCNRTDLDELLSEGVMYGQCDLFLHFEGDWAKFIHAMLEQAAMDYDDAGFADRSASPEDRVRALQATDLMIQMDLAPNSRIPADNSTDQTNTMVYLGPSSLDNQLYTVPMAVQYTVSTDSVEFRKAADEPLITYTGPAPSEFTFEEFEPFALYPPPANASITIDASAVTGGASREGNMREPFAGAIPTVTQVASPSSAAIGGLSGLVPSLMAQLASLGSYAIQADNSTDSFSQQFFLDLYTASVGKLYTEPVAYEVSVCSQWPEPCTDRDARFVDGGYTDGASLALNVGKYQQSSEGDIDKLMKVILTNTNERGNLTASHPFLVYFANPTNAGVDPGSYMWSTGSLPMQSLQIFDLYLDEEGLDLMLQPIKGTTLRTARVNATTIDNAAYGIVSGQKIEILLIELNALIPTIILSEDDIDLFTTPLARMAETIASSDDLAAIVQDFVSPHDGSDISSSVPMSRYVMGMLMPLLGGLTLLFVA